MPDTPSSSDSPLSNQTHRVKELDALRGVAAATVMLFHYFPSWLAQTPEYQALGFDRVWFTVPWGRYGVQLFFVISGYVILMTLNRTRSVTDFAASRFARLFPAYWAGCVLTYTGISILGYPGYSVTPWQALLNLPMVAVPGSKAIEGVYWTLREEMWFYLVMGGLLAIGRLRWCFVVMGGLVFSSLCTLAFTRFMSLFLLGMVLYDARSAFRRRHAVLLALCAADIIRRAMFGKRGDMAGWEYVGAITLCAGLVLGATRGWLRWLAVPPLLFLGRISYCLYLIHASLGMILARELAKRGMPANISLLCAVAAAVTGAWLLHVGVERPAGNAIRRWYATRSTRQAQTTIDATKQA